MRLSALLLLCACTSSTPPEAERLPAPEPAKPVEAAVAVTPTPAPPVPTPSPFHVVGTVGESPEGEGAAIFRLFEADGHVFVTAGPQVMRVGDDGSIARDPKWLAGLTAFREAGMEAMYGLASWGVVTAGGRWPDAFYITLTAEFGFRGEGYPNAVYRRTAERWVAIDTRGKHHYSFPRDLAPWKDGSVLALRGFAPAYEFVKRRDETDEPSEAEVHRAQASIERERPLAVIRGAAKAPDLGRRDLAAFEALDSGEIVAVVEGDAPLAVHFDPASGSAVERRLPPAARGLVYADVLLEASARAWIFGRLSEDADASPYLARFDGEAWVDEVAPPCDDGLASYSRTREGQAWAVCAYPALSMEVIGKDGTLWRRDEGDAWKPVTLPEESDPVSVLARGPDDVWVAGGKLLHTRAPAQTIVVPTYSNMANEIFELSRPAAPFACQSGTVLLSGAPAGEHEELRATLAKAFAGADEWASNGSAGVSLVEVEFRGEARLALQFVLIDRKPVTRRATAALGDRMLETYCVHREATREIDSW